MGTIEEAKQYLRNNFRKGVKCPCCDQYVKLYRRNITSAMAIGLIKIHKYFKNDYDQVEWLHIENYFKNLDVPSSIRGDLSKLILWGLLERKPGIREDGSKRNGYYRITQKGKDFVEGLIEIPKYVYIYNQNVIKIGGNDETTTIQDCLNAKFDYNELMNS